MGISQHAQITGGEQMVALLQQQVQQAAALVNAAVAQQQEDFEERQRARAVQNDEWADLAGDFSSWEDEDGNYAYGIQEEGPSAEKARRLEYGDDEHPPVPLMRMGVMTDVADIGWSLQQHFRQGGF